MNDYEDDIKLKFQGVVERYRFFKLEQRVQHRSAAKVQDWFRASMHAQKKESFLKLLGFGLGHEFASIQDENNTKLQQLVKNLASKEEKVQYSTEEQEVLASIKRQWQQYFDDTSYLGMDATLRYFLLSEQMLSLSEHAGLIRKILRDRMGGVLICAQSQPTDFIITLKSMILNGLSNNPQALIAHSTINHYEKRISDQGRELNATDRMKSFKDYLRPALEDLLEGAEAIAIYDPRSAQCHDKLTPLFKQIYRFLRSIHDPGLIARLCHIPGFDTSSMQKQSELHLVELIKSLRPQSLSELIDQLLSGRFIDGGEHTGHFILDRAHMLHLIFIDDKYVLQTSLSKETFTWYDLLRGLFERIDASEASTEPDYMRYARLSLNARLTTLARFIEEKDYRNIGDFDSVDAECFRLAIEGAMSSLAGRQLLGNAINSAIGIENFREIFESLQRLSKSTFTLEDLAAEKSLTPKEIMFTMPSITRHATKSEHLNNIFKSLTLTASKNVSDKHFSTNADEQRGDQHLICTGPRDIPADDDSVEINLRLGELGEKQVFIRGSDPGYHYNENEHEFKLRDLTFVLVKNKLYYKGRSSIPLFREYLIEVGEKSFIIKVPAFMECFSGKLKHAPIFLQTFLEHILSCLIAKAEFEHELTEEEYRDAINRLFESDFLFQDLEINFYNIKLDPRVVSSVELPKGLHDDLPVVIDVANLQDIKLSDLHRILRNVTSFYLLNWLMLIVQDNYALHCEIKRYDARRPEKDRVLDLFPESEENKVDLNPVLYRKALKFRDPGMLTSYKRLIEKIGLCPDNKQALQDLYDISVYILDKRINLTTDRFNCLVELADKSVLLQILRKISEILRAANEHLFDNLRSHSNLRPLACAIDVLEKYTAISGDSVCKIANQRGEKAIYAHTIRQIIQVRTKADIGIVVSSILSRIKDFEENTAVQDWLIALKNGDDHAVQDFKRITKPSSYMPGEDWSDLAFTEIYDSSIFRHNVAIERMKAQEAKSKCPVISEGAEAEGLESKCGSSPSV